MSFASGVVVTGGGSCVRVCVCAYKYGTRGAHIAGRCLFSLRVRVRVCLCAFRSFVVVIEGATTTTFCRLEQRLDFALFTELANHAQKLEHLVAVTQAKLCGAHLGRAGNEETDTQMVP